MGGQIVHVDADRRLPILNTFDEIDSAARAAQALDYSSRHRSVPGYGRLVYLRRKLGLELRPFAPIRPRPRQHTRYNRIVDEIRTLEAGLVGHLGEINRVLERRVRKLK